MKKRTPVALAGNISLQTESQVELSMTEEQENSLGNLLMLVNDDHLQDGFDFGKPIGDEVW